jgi:hypothetical protein
MKLWMKMGNTVILKKAHEGLQWFLLIPRLQWLFMSHHTTSHMMWHANGHTKDGVLRHPTDGEA